MSASPNKLSPKKTIATADKVEQTMTVQGMTKYKSPNCAGDADATALFTFFAAEGKKDFQSHMVSCQKTELEKPDAETLAHMKLVSMEQLGSKKEVEIEAHSIRLGLQGTKNAAKDLVKHRMASSCAPSYNLNSITAYNRFECHYLGTGIDDTGREVRNPFQKWRGTLPSCENSIEISDELMSDVKKLAYDAAGGDEAKLDINQFLCTISSIPT